MEVKLLKQDFIGLIWIKIDVYSISYSNFVCIKNYLIIGSADMNDWFTVEKIDNATYIISELNIGKRLIAISSLVIILAWYQLYQGDPSFLLYDSEIIQLGDREVTVIHTPGHSPRHICFYEEHQGYLYSGDLIYEGTLAIIHTKDISSTS